MINVDTIRVIEKKTLEFLFELKGWTLRTPLFYKDKVLIMPDFYPANYILGHAKSALIICDGSSVINYRNREFNSVEELVSVLGEGEIVNYENWEFTQVKEWAVLKLNGKFLQCFSNPLELKTTKELRCR